MLGQLFMQCLFELQLLPTQHTVINIKQPHISEPKLLYLRRNVCQVQLKLSSHLHFLPSWLLSLRWTLRYLCGPMPRLFECECLHFLLLRLCWKDWS